MDDTAAPALAAASSPAGTQQHAADEPADVALATGLRAAVATEPVDSTWAPEMSRALESALSAIAGSRVESVRCATSMCRVVILHESETARDELSHAVADLSEFEGEVFGFFGGEFRDRMATEIFVARVGMSLDRERYLLPETP